MEHAFQFEQTKTLRRLALSLDHVTEGTSCVNRAFKVGKKNFVFLGEKPETWRLMVKLGDSADEAAELASTQEGYSFGKTKWATVQLPPGDDTDLTRLERWIRESYALMAPKKKR